MTIIIPVCVSCIHYEGKKKCSAFPQGIPEEIIRGENDHSQPVKGDGGIRYTPDPTESIE